MLTVAGDHNNMTSQGFRETYFVSPDIYLSDILTGRSFVRSSPSGYEVTNNIAPKPNNERVLLKLVGDFVDIMCQVNPEHKKNVTYEKGRKVLYMEVL